MKVNPAIITMMVQNSLRLTKSASWTTPPPEGPGPLMWAIMIILPASFLLFYMLSGR